MSNQIKILHGTDRETIKRLFGRSIEECVQALELLDNAKKMTPNVDWNTILNNNKIFWEKVSKERPMTKNEAIDTVKLVMGYGQNIADQFVKALIALKVLKVEEEKEELMSLNEQNTGNWVVVKISHMIEELEKCGYRVDKRT